MKKMSGKKQGKSMMMKDSEMMMASGRMSGMMSEKAMKAMHAKQMGHAKKRMGMK